MQNDLNDLISLCLTLVLCLISFMHSLYTNLKPWNLGSIILFIDFIDVLVFQVLFVSPERFTSEEFLSLLSASRTVSLVVVDEVHCVSEW